MSTAIAVQGCTIKYSADNAASVSPVATLSTADGIPTSDGNKAYKNNIMITITGGAITMNTPPEGASSPSGTITAGVITISGSSEKAVTKGLSFVLKGDEGSSQIVCMFPTSSSPYTMEVTIEIKATVDDPGQNVVFVT